MKTTTFSMRIDPIIKQQADSLFSTFGITTTDAINMFLTKSIMERGLPFELRQSNYQEIKNDDFTQKTLSIEEIKSGVTEVATKYGNIKSAILFGSYADGLQTNKSDIDLLVEFKELVGYFTLFELQEELEKKFRKKVEVVPAPLPEDTFLEINNTVVLYA